MATKTYDSLEDFYADVEAAMPKIMEEYVAPYVEDILSEFIERCIYDVYTPKENGWVHGTYQRRHALTSGIFSKIEDDYLSTTSNAPPNRSITGATTWGSDGGAFFDLLASGNMGLWRGGFPRPVIPIAQAEIDRNIQLLDNLCQKGLDAIMA